MSVDAHSDDAQNTTISADNAEDLLEVVISAMKTEVRLHTETGENTHKNRGISLIDVKSQLEDLTEENTEAVDLSNITPLKTDMEKPACEALAHHAEPTLNSDSLTELLKELATKA